MIGGNVAECAGGPRAFKYGMTKQYVLGLEAVLPTGEIIDTGGKVVKNVVGYDLTHLLVGSEGTLAIITRDHPAADAEAAGAGDAARDVPQRSTDAVDAVSSVIRARVVPAARRADRRRLARGGRDVPRTCGRSRRAGTGALLLIEVDGLRRAVAEEATRVEQACRDAGATEVLRARDEAERAGALARAPRAVARR